MFLLHRLEESPAPMPDCGTRANLVMRFGAPLFFRDSHFAFLGFIVVILTTFPFLS
jgi:hypothetical protein